MPRRFAWLLALAPLSLFLSALASPIAAQGDKKQDGQVAICTKIEGALLQRDKDGKFKAVKSGDPIPANTLLVGFPKAELEPNCAKVKINLLLYIGDKLPVREAAVKLHESSEVDTDLTLERGIIGLKGIAKKG